MRIAKRLKLLIDIFSIVFLLILAGMIVNTLLFYSSGNTWNGLKNGPNIVRYFGVNHLLLIISNVLLMVGVLYLRKAMKAILNTDYFSLEVTKNLKRTGITFVITGVTYIIIQIVSLTGTPALLSMKFSLKTFHVDTLEVHGLFFIILGMFFMLTSYIFTQARQYKQENDLTI
ncbi:DUF2975 domain-containing protein [Pontimicrobium sp. MEBiC01747]